MRFPGKWLALTVLVGGACVNLAVAQVSLESDKKAKEKKKVELPKCPVAGEDTINFNVSTMTDDGPVYFCCPHCIEKFTKNAKKYADKVAEQRKILHQLPAVQVTCPVSGEPVDAKIGLEVDGHKVHFCCDKCVAKYKKDPAKYRGSLAGCFTYQTKCPVSGKPIDPSAAMTNEDGTTIYFCCKDCPATFKADPKPYLGKLAEQGYVFEADKKGVRAKKDM